MFQETYSNALKQTQSLMARNSRSSSPATPERLGMHTGIDYVTNPVQDLPSEIDKVTLQKMVMSQIEKSKKQVHDDYQKAILQQYNDYAPSSIPIDNQ